MKQKLLNAIIVDLIDKLDFVPSPRESGTLIPPAKMQQLERRDISEYHLIELIDLDYTSDTHLKAYYTQEANWVRNLEILDFTGRPSLIGIFLMQSYDEAKVNLLKSLQNNAIDKGMNTAFIIIDSENSDLISDWGLLEPLKEIEYILGYWLDNDPSQFETMPDIESIVYKHEPEPVLKEVSKSAPATYVLLSVNILVWLAGIVCKYIYSKNYIVLWGVKNNTLILNREYWRVLTPVFLHNDIAHLMTNSFSLLIFGSIIERVFGTGKFLSIYFAAGLAGNIMSFVFSKYNSLGASGAIMGISGALIYVWTRNRYFFSLRRKPYLVLVFLAFFNIFYGLLSPGIDNYAHIGGFICGYALAVLFNLNSEVD